MPSLPAWPAWDRLAHHRKGVLVILGGTASGQLLALLAAPVLSRLYTPADFGTFTVISSLTLTVGTVAAMRFDLAISLPEQDRDAHGLVLLGFLAILVSTTVGSAIVLLFGSTIASGFDQQDLRQWLWLVPPTAAAMGAFLVLNQLTIRQRRYGAVGRRNVLQQAVTVGTQLCAGAAHLRPGGLILGLGLGQAVGAVSLLRGSQLTGRQARDGRGPIRLWALASRYRRFPLLLAPSGLVNALGLQLPVILIALWYGSSVAGWLGLTQRVLSLPVTLLGAAIAQVYLGELSRMARTGGGRTHLLFTSTSRNLILVAVVIATPVALFGPPAFSSIFGTVWLSSGEYARALSVSLGAQLLATPLSHTLTVFERQATQLAWDIGRLTVTCSAVAVCKATHQTPLVAVWALSLASTAAYLASWILCSRAVRRATAAPSPPRRTTSSGRR